MIPPKRTHKTAPGYSRGKTTTSELAPKVGIQSHAEEAKIAKEWDVDPEGPNYGPEDAEGWDGDPT